MRTFYMNKHSEQREHEHNGTFLGELICHTPYAIFSVAFCLIIVSFISFATLGTMNPKLVHKGAKMLFHSFHFMHLIFAGTGVLITFLDFQKMYLRAYCWRTHHYDFLYAFRFHFALFRR